MWPMPGLRERYLTDVEYQQVRILFDAIIPAHPDKGMPGAVEAGAVDFLTKLLALGADHYHKIPQWRAAYSSGLPELDSAARQRFDTSLRLLSMAQSTELLLDLEGANLKGLPKTFDQKAFFRMLRLHCIQGCFSDPRWGGNRDGMMWQWLGWIVPAEDLPVSTTGEQKTKTE